MEGGEGRKGSGGRGREEYCLFISSSPCSGTSSVRLIPPLGPHSTFVISPQALSPATLKIRTVTYGFGMGGGVIHSAHSTPGRFKLRDAIILRTKSVLFLLEPGKCCHMAAGVPLLGDCCHV